jgi:hypothetical protein
MLMKHRNRINGMSAPSPLITIKMANRSKNESSSKSELEANLVTLDMWLIAFGVLVAIGVTGEAIVGFLHWRGSNRLQSLNNAEMEVLRKDVAEAVGKAEEEHAARLKIQAQLAPRQITSSQKDVLIRWLEPYKDAPLKTVTMIDVGAYGNDSEALLLAHQLASIFTESGCKTTFESIITLVRVPIGILVEYDPADAQWFHIANGVANALRRVDLLVSPIQPMSSGPFESPIRVIVGRK